MIGCCITVACDLQIDWRVSVVTLLYLCCESRRMNPNEIVVIFRSYSMTHIIVFYFNITAIRRAAFIAHIRNAVDVRSSYVKLSVID